MLTQTNRFTYAVFTLCAGFCMLAGCTTAPRYRGESPDRSSVSVGEKTVRISGRDVVRRAESFLGAPYRFGGSSAQGLDCSGLVYQVFRQIGIALPRTSRAQSGFGASVGRAQLRAGDLVFFKTGRGGAISHVGIYAGGGEFIHASTRSRRVRYDRLDNRYFRNRFVTARRVL